MQQPPAETDRLLVSVFFGFIVSAALLSPALLQSMVPWSLVKRPKHEPGSSVGRSKPRIFWCLWSARVAAGLLTAAPFGAMWEHQELRLESYVLRLGLFSFLAEEVGALSPARAKTNVEQRLAMSGMWVLTYRRSRVILAATLSLASLVCLLSSVQMQGQTQRVVPLAVATVHRLWTAADYVNAGVECAQRRKEGIHAGDRGFLRRPEVQLFANGLLFLCSLTMWAAIAAGPDAVFDVVGVFGCLMRVRRG